MISPDVLQELMRKKRVADMLVSAHSMLAQRYKAWATALDIALMATALGVTAVSIAALYQRDFTFYGLQISLDRLAVDSSCIIVFISLVQWKVDWKARSDRHYDAFREYGILKAELIRLIANSHIVGIDEVRSLNDRYTFVGSKLEPIPHDKFVALKKAHAQKVYVSKLIDKFPFLSSSVLRLYLVIRQTRKALHHA